MRLSILLIALAGPVLCTGPAALANGASIWWPGWSVSSSEELSGGIKYSRNDYTPDFPLSLMLDRNPATAWVWSATSRDWDHSVFSSPRGIRLEPKRAVTINGLRLMNGQNQSEARFRSNARATRIRVTTELSHSKGGSKTSRLFSLPDRRGWHTVKLPRSRVRSLKIEFVGVRGPGGPKSDLCISELELLDGARRIDLRMPQAVMFYDGLEGCGSSHLITRGGRELAGVTTAIGYQDSWSPSGRYVSGLQGDPGRLWIADAWRGQMLPRALKIKAALGDKLGDKKWLAKVLADARLAGPDRPQVLASGA